MARRDRDDVHDVLAADEFPPPAGADADTVQARAHRLPPDLTGDPDEAHDILAAESFAMPAPEPVGFGSSPAPPSAGWGRLTAAALLGAAVALLLRRGR